jgi:hypothetical protein
MPIASMLPSNVNPAYQFEFFIESWNFRLLC